MPNPTVSVLGSAVPGMVEANGEAMIGQELVIQGLRFEVVGLQAEKGGQVLFNPDERILIPLETGQYLVHGSDRVGSITAQEATETFTFLLAGIAAVSFLVGGIGIMNIMLVSVTERTREIGLSKAVGATRRNIMFQFLVEALTLCMMGGAIGVIVGAGGAEALHRFKDWNTLVSPRAVILAFAFSAAVGIFFGSGQPGERRGSTRSRR